MVVYVHIEYSTYQFSEELKGGGGGIHPPPWSLWYRKKRGPERVNMLPGVYWYPVLVLATVGHAVVDGELAELLPAPLRHLQPHVSNLVHYIHQHLGLYIYIN